jgi:glycine dehydrogenase
VSDSDRSPLHPTLPPFVARHVGPDSDAITRMLASVGQPTLDGLIDRAVPAAIRTTRPLDLPAPVTEAEVTAELRALAAHNQPAIAMIGDGYHRTFTPPVVRRNVLESPSWYTAYTPYQPEISQGRLEAIITFQTMVSDLTGLPVANASLLDEATAVAEAVTLMRRAGRSPSPRVVVDAEVLPQTLAVLRTRCAPLGIEIDVADLTDGLPAGDLFGLVLQAPGRSGVVRDLAQVAADAHERGAMVTVSADLLALTVLTPPGAWGADVAVGSSQRFGVPLFAGGPHAAFMAVREASSARSRAGSSGSAWTPTEHPPTASPCRPASSTSAARRRRRTSARRRSSWPWSPASTRSGTAPTGCGASHWVRTTMPA